VRIVRDRCAVAMRRSSVGASSRSPSALGRKQDGRMSARRNAQTSNGANTASPLSDTTVR